MKVYVLTTDSCTEMGGTEVGARRKEIMKRYKFVFTEKQLAYIVDALGWGYEEWSNYNKRDYERFGGAKWDDCEEQNKAEGVYGMALRKKIMEKVGWKD